MKRFTLINVFIALCFFGIAQTKKPVAPKRARNDSAANVALKQEKLWPVFNKNAKNANPVIKQPAVVVTWNKL
jgi:hypothetical protein